MDSPLPSRSRIAQAAVDNGGAPATARYQRKRELILDAATRLINESGAKGMTLAGVAEAVGLNTTSVTYYFKRKEQLAAACYGRAFDVIETIVQTAAGEASPRERVRAYIHHNFLLRARIRRGEARPLTVLSDLRALDGPERLRLADRYRVILRTVRGFFGTPASPAAKAVLTARTHVLVETVFWLPGWLNHYDIDDFARLEARMFEIFEKGLAPDGVAWTPPIGRLDDIVDEAADSARTHFLLAATKLINERGYRGASVERIASERNVTKGSFYHHLDAKDDLVVACFERSFETVARAQDAGLGVGSNQWQRLSSAIAILLDAQLSERAPLLRTTALQALPPELRGAMVDRSDHVARRFAGMMIDGISEGSIRAIDPLIASQMLMSMLNAAFELHSWAAHQDADAAIATYASTLAYGLFTPA